MIPGIFWFLECTRICFTSVRTAFIEKRKWDYMADVCGSSLLTRSYLQLAVPTTHSRILAMTILRLTTVWATTPRVLPQYVLGKELSRPVPFFFRKKKKKESLKEGKDLIS